MSTSSQLKEKDEALLYEEWLLKYRTVEKQGRGNDDGGDAAMRLLMARAGLMGALECAAGDDDGTVRYLLEQTRLDHDDDCDESSAAISFIDNSNCKNRLTLQNQVGYDADAFFEEYPECAQNIKEFSDDSESSESEDEQVPAAKSSKRKPSPTSTLESPLAADGGAFSYSCPSSSSSSHANNSATAIDLTAAAPEPSSTHHHPPPNQQQQPSESNSSFKAEQQPVWQQPNPSAPPASRPQLVNPYTAAAKSSNNRGYDNTNPQQQLPPVRPITNTSSNGHSNNNSSWDDHCSNQNPFQTAREYAWATSDEPQQQQQPSTHRQNHPPQQQQQQQQGYHNPYRKMESPPPPAPVIRESLKRKFQPPKRGVAAETGKPLQTGPRTAGAAPARGGVIARPPKQSAKAAADCTSEEDELPEELKRFGKDLVEKIENEIMESGDSISFEQIAGLVDQKQTVQEVVCWPMKRPDLFTGLRSAPNGLLLYGPPGTGKTLIGKAIAHESGATFFSISSSSLTSKWIGEGEKLVRVLFAVAAYRNPAVVFIDEIDSLLTQRKADENEASRRIKTEFLVQLDGTGTSGQGRVLVIGATNRPQELDEAARRRFTKRLYIPLPEEDDRETLIRVLLESNNHQLGEEQIKKLAKETAGFSGADLKALSSDAAMGPIRELGARALQVDVKDVPPISYKHFRQSLRGMKPSVAPSDLVQYLEWDKTYGSKRAENDEDGDSDDN